jgi:hypothetical protein
MHRHGWKCFPCALLERLDKVVQELDDLVAAVGTLTTVASDLGGSITTEGQNITAAIKRVEAVIAAAGTGGINPADLAAPIQAIKDAVTSLQQSKITADTSAAEAAGERP